MAELMNVVQKTIQDAVEITAPANTEAVDVSGCRSIYFEVDVTEDVAVTDCSAVMEKTIDGTNWVEEGNEQAITESTVLGFEKIDPTALKYRIHFEIAAGTITVTTKVLGKGVV